MREIFSTRKRIRESSTRRARERILKICRKKSKSKAKPLALISE